MRYGITWLSEEADQKGWGHWEQSHYPLKKVAIATRLKEVQLLYYGKIILMTYIDSNAPYTNIGLCIRGSNLDREG